LNSIELAQWWGEDGHISGFIMRHFSISWETIKYWKKILQHRIWWPNVSDDLQFPPSVQVKDNTFLTGLYTDWRDFLVETRGGRGWLHEEAEGILGVVWGSFACEMVEPCSPPWSLWQIATWWPVSRVVASPTARGQATLLRYIILQTPLTFEMKLITRRRPAASES
jgi:hypothetical protein